jgi:SAM-dependent methyltransferase
MQTIYSDGTYLANHENWHIEDSPWKASQISKIIRKNNVPFETAVEVGCGAGRISYELASQFTDKSFAGFDISPQASHFWAQFQRDNLVFNVQNFLETSKIYDLLLLIDVFEHVPDYMGFLESLSTRSNYFIFNIPIDMHLVGVLLDNQIHGRNKYGHLHYFSQATALRTLVDTGYEICDHFYAPGFCGVPPESGRKTWKQKLLYPARSLFYSLSPSFSAKLLGGVSVMVLAKSANN